MPHSLNAGFFSFHVIEKGKTAVKCSRFMPDPAINRCSSSRAHNLGLRAVAGVVLAIFLLPLFLPFFHLSPESSLPPCCRRDGKHHCAMSARFLRPVLSPSTEPAVRAATSPCPYRSRLLMPLVSRVLFVPAEPVFSVPVVSYPGLGLETILLVRLSEFRSHFERGPPPLLA